MLTNWTLTCNFFFFNIFFLGGSFRFWGIWFTDGDVWAAAIQEQLVHSFSSLHWVIFSFSGEDFSLTAFLFLPPFSGALMFACQKRTDGFSCSAMGGGLGRKHIPWTGNTGLEKLPSVVLTAGVVSVGSLRKENCLKFCCCYHCHHYCYYMPLETTIYASSHG